LNTVPSVPGGFRNAGFSRESWERLPKRIGSMSGINRSLDRKEGRFGDLGYGIVGGIIAGSAGGVGGVGSADCGATGISPRTAPIRPSRVWPAITT
jgi:hypothetical protein